MVALVSEVSSDDELIARVLSGHPVPIADAMAALQAADNPFERRDRVVETFRATLRWLSGVALAARLQFGAGPGKESNQLADQLRGLRSRGLTDGQWFALLRELARPWAKAAEGHPLPHLVTLLHGKKARFPKLVDELLLMRKAETVAHGASGSRPELERILERRLPQLLELLALTDPLWRDARVLLPGEDGTSAQLWMGVTPAGGRFRRIAIDPPQPPGELVLFAGDTPRLALHPVFVVESPSPGAIDEIFTLDRGGKRGAVFCAFPSMAERTLEGMWEALGGLFEGATGAALEAPAQERPFRGLASFGPEHADMFHGRERQAEALANRIRRVGMLTVTGPSGAGKTSLLAAGALPQIGDLEVVVMRPGPTPLARLAAALGAPEDRITAPIDATIDRRLALVVDQAEELITLCKDDEERARFGELLLALSRSGRVRVVISVREDFFARLGAIPGLRDHYNAEVEVVATPDDDALARTLVAPLTAFGFAFEDGELLVEMIGAVAGEPAALALLQFCADRLWELRDRRWKRLTWEAYRAIGGVIGALAAHADGVVEGLHAAQRAAARRILLRLVTPERTRAVVDEQALLEAGGDGARVVIDRLVASRLVTAGDDGRLELVHEALIGHWETLQGWLGADEEGQRLAFALHRAAEEWARRGEPRGLLWRGEALDDLRRWRRRAAPVLTRVEERFAAASERDERRGRLIRRGLAALALALTTGAAVVLFALWRQAVEARNRAETRGLVAQAREREPRGESAEAAALYRAALALGDPQHLEVAVDIERLRRGGALGRELAGHAGPVWRVALRPGGGQIASASVDGTLRLWDAATGALEHQLGGHAGIVEAVAYAPDGRTVATASGSLSEPRGEVFLFSSESGALLRRFEGHTAPALRLAFGDGYLASASRDRTVRLWPLPEGAPRILAHDKAVTDLAVLDDLVVSASGGDVFLWDGATGVLVDRLVDHGPGVLRLDAAGDTIVAGASRGQIKLWDRSGALLALIDEPAACVAIDPAGRVAASGHDDGTVRLWDPSSGQPLAAFRGHEPVAALAFSSDGAWLVSAAGREARVWDVAERGLAAIHGGHRDVLHDVAIGEALVTASADRSVRIFASEARPAWLARGLDPVAVAHAPGGARALLLWRDRALVLDGEGARELPLDGATAASWLDERRWLVSDGAGLARHDAGGAVRLAGPQRLVRAAAGRWSVLGAEGVAMGSEGAGCVVAGEGDALAVSPDGHRTLVARGRSARIYDEACRPGPELAGHEADVAALAWSPDGRRAITTSRHTARVWDAASGASLQIFTGHEKTVRATAVSPDQRWLATASDDGNVRLFDLAGGAIAHTMVGHARPVTHVAFTADGTFLASGGDDGTVRMWDVESGELIERLDLGGGAIVAMSLGDELIAMAESGIAGAFAIPPLDLEAARRTAGALTNFRVCRADQTVVPVLPFPDPDTIWADPSLCGEAAAPR